MAFNFTKLAQSNFFRNLAALLTGNALAQAITLVSIPVLTRLYTPEEFGAIALYIAIVNLFGMVSTGSYDTAIMIPKRSSEAFNLLAGCIGLVAIASLACLAAIVLFGNNLASLFEAESYRLLIWLIPLLVFLQGSHKALYSWYNRHRYFKAMGLNRVIQNSGQVGTRLNRWAFPDGHWGLAIGYLAGLLAGWISIFTRVFKKEAWKLNFISRSSIFKVFKKHRDFPAYLLPMTVINSFSVHLLIYVLSFITTSYWVGIYERAWRVISLPTSLLANAFGSVFFERFSKTKKRERLFVLSYTGNLVFISILMIPVAIWAEEIFVFALGKDWEIAGSIARLLLPLTILNYATSCISTLFSVVGKNKILLAWQIAYLLIMLGWVIGARDLDMKQMILVYSLIGGGLYFILAIIGYKLVASSEIPEKAAL